MAVFITFNSPSVNNSRMNRVQKVTSALDSSACHHEDEDGMWLALLKNTNYENLKQVQVKFRYEL